MFCATESINQVFVILALFPNFNVLIYLWKLSQFTITIFWEIVIDIWLTVMASFMLYKLQTAKANMAVQIFPLFQRQENDF